MFVLLAKSIISFIYARDDNNNNTGTNIQTDVNKLEGMNVHFVFVFEGMSARF